MQHEKIIKRDDGSKVKIFVFYQFEKWKSDFSLTDKNGESDLWAKEVKPPTPAEILAAKLELWEKIKPV